MFVIFVSHKWPCSSLVTKKSPRTTHPICTTNLKKGGRLDAGKSCIKVVLHNISKNYNLVTNSDVATFAGRGSPFNSSLYETLLGVSIWSWVQPQVAKQSMIC